MSRNLVPRDTGRRVAALGLLASASVAAVILGATGPVSAQEPDVAAWWNATNAGDPAPAPPAPPDVADDDLFVEGSNAGPAGSPLGGAPTSAQAVAGLAFDLQPSDLVGALTLTIDGSPPPQVSVVACRATERFSSAHNGPWAQVPTYDGDACVSGKLHGSNLVFADVSKLVADSSLAVVLLPGPLDRVVFKPPSDKTLAVSDGGGVGSSAPPLGAGTSAGGGGGVGHGGGAAPAAGGSSTAPVGGSDVVAPTTGLPGQSTTDGSAGAAPPVVAQPDGTPPTVAGQDQRPVAAQTGLSTDARRGIALAVIALEVVGYVLLMRSPAPAAVATAGAAGAGAVATAGGRLRAPDRGVPLRGTGRGLGPVTTAGVGRFRRDRQGPPPRL